MTLPPHLKALNPDLDTRQLKDARLKHAKTTDPKEWENKLFDQLLEAGLPQPLRQVPFAKIIRRNWTADFGWGEERILCEVEGAVWAQGRHTRGGGYTEDCIKYSWASILGWTLVRVTPGMIADGTALRLLTEAFERKDEGTMKF